jgi:hypothetical protein
MVILSTARMMSLGGKVMCGLRMVLPRDLGLGGLAQVRVRRYVPVDAVYTHQLSAVWVEGYPVPAHIVYMWYRYMNFQTNTNATKGGQSRWRKSWHDAFWLVREDLMPCIVDR